MAIESEELTESYFVSVIDSAVKQGRFQPDISPLLPMLIKAMLQDWYVKRAKYRRRKISVDTYISTVQEFVLGACLPAQEFSEQLNCRNG